MENQLNKVTLVDVRDAIIDCLYEAHCAEIGLGEDELLENRYCFKVVKRTFAEQGVDFDNPTREGIIKVLGALGDFSKTFRSPDIIEEHQSKILTMLDRVD